MTDGHVGSQKKVAASKKRPQRIMIVDDHPLVREGLVSLIRMTSDLTVSGQAGSSDEAKKELAKNTHDLLLLDLSLPGGSGIELLKEVCSRYTRLRVLVLSMYEEGVYAERVLRAGAHGYIMKQEPGARIVEAIRCVLRGELYVGPAIAAQLVKQFLDGKQVDTCADIGKLSDRELQVYMCLGNGMTSQQIAERFGLSVKTVHTHREHIKRKLGLLNATNLVHHAIHWIQTCSGQAQP